MENYNEQEQEITLEQLLRSRDERAEFQKILLKGYGLPLVSFTVNMPGKIKRCRRSRIVFDAGVQAIREALAGEIVYYKLMDIDVLDASGQHLSRTQLGETPRKCLVCGGMAAACTRSRAHPAEEVLAAVDRILAAWEQESHDPQ